jgi:hypothetical protein
MQTAPSTNGLKPHRLRGPATVIGIVLAGLVLLAGSIRVVCDAMVSQMFDLDSLDGVPDGMPGSRDILQWPAVRPFLAEAKAIEGIYFNADVDSLLFAYQTNVNDEAFWRTIGIAAAASGWNLTIHEGAIAVFERCPPHDPTYSRLASLEQVRVCKHIGKPRVVVGWVQADEDTSRKSFEESDEARWADGVIWPQFEDAGRDGS